jgi:diaminopimelate decarboxylase
MDDFHYRDGRYHAEQVDLSTVAAECGTPCYVYSRHTLEQHWRAFDQALAALPHMVCYAVKANSNLAILKLLADLGSGFDIVSGGELERVLRAGASADKVVFSGVGKSTAELRRALQVGIHCFNVESAAELRRLNQIAAELGCQAPVSLRVNPDVDAQTHPYISTGLKENKFGVTIEEAQPLYREAAAMAHIRIRGVDCHIGSQLTSISPFLDALKRILALLDTLASEGIQVEHLDLGGGLGVRYRDETPPHPEEYAHALRQILADKPYRILIEPGRAIAANAGVFLTRVEYLKPTPHKNFAIVDGAMNDLIRPALYNAWQDIKPVQPRYDVEAQVWDIVGPVCETGDFLGKGRELALGEGDVVAVRGAGAYGFVMSSQYNTRPRVPEILVDGDSYSIVRRRETLDDLLALENL